MTELPTLADALHAQGDAREATMARLGEDVQEQASKHMENGNDSTEEDDDRNDDSNSGSLSSQPPSHAPHVRRQLKANTTTTCTNVNRPVAFQSTHALKFGLEVVARDAETSAVTAALCLFCKHFGREPRPGAKRRATTNFKYFKGTFRTDQYLQHHRLQHPAKWLEYEAASLREKQVFFPRYVISADLVEGAELADGAKKPALKAKRQRRVSGENDAAVRAAATFTDDSSDAAAAVTVHGQGSRPFLQVDLPAAIVALFLGETSWEPRALVSTERVRTALVGNGKSTQIPQDVYNVPITDRVAFDVAVDLCASGLSTRQTTCAMHAMAKYVPHGAALASIWAELVQNYTQVATFGSLAMVSKLMADSWAFSIGIHRSHGDKIDNGIDVRVRVAGKTLDDLHLCRLAVAPGLLEDKLVRGLDVVCPHWVSSLIAISVDGDLFASNSAVVSTIQALRSRATMDESTFRLVWNGQTLLARGFRAIFAQLMDGAFAKRFHQLKSYIKSQSALIQEIGHEPHAGQAPGNQTTNEDEQSLDALITTTRWICEKRVRIRKYLEEQQREGDHYHYQPSEVWWLCLSVFDWIASATLHASSGLRSQLGRDVLTTEQPKPVQELIDVLSTAFKVTTTSTLVEMPTVNTIQCSSARGDFVTTKRSVLEFTVELGSFVNSLMAGLHDGELDVLVKSLGGTISSYVETLTLGLDTAAKVLDLAPNSGASELPVFPHELAKCGGKEFATLVGTYRSLLLCKFSDEEIDAIEQEHQALKRATREKEFPSWAVDAPRDRLAVFDAAWARTLGRFRMLHAFAAGLATVFPRDDGSRRVDTYTTSRDSTSTIGSSGAELLDLQVEAPLHAAQFHHLQRAVASEHPTPRLL